MEEATQTEEWRTQSRARELLSLPWAKGPRSESQLIDMAIASGMIDKFLNEDAQFLTIRGRLRSPRFSFYFPTTHGAHKVRVRGVQIEVDAGLEGANLNLIEAKLGKRTDFHVRQLYYPMQMWSIEVPAKRTRTVFMSYSDRVYSLRLYSFNDRGNYGSIALEKAADFTLDAGTGPVDLRALLLQTRAEVSPVGVTFPQADDLAKVLDLVDATAAGITTSHGIVERYGFTARQALYYPTAARYLGLLDSQRPDHRLTDLGSNFVASPRDERHRMVLERLVALPVFRETLEYALEKNESLPDRAQISDWIEAESRRAGIPLSGTTLSRRAATVRSWVQWALLRAKP